MSLQTLPQEITVDTGLILSNYKEISQTPTSPDYKAFITGFIDRIDIGKYVVDITLKTGLDVSPALNITYHIRRQEIYEWKKVS